MQTDQSLRAGAPGDLILSRSRGLSTGLSAARSFASKKPLGALCGVILVVLVLLACFCGFIAPYHYDDVHVAVRLHGPSLSHPFGTDRQGRDVMSRVIYGARTSVVVGLSAVAIATTLATIIGMLSAYLAGLFDLLIQRLVDIWQSFPGLIFLLFVISVVGRGELTLIVSLSLLFAAGSSRIIRSQVFVVKHLDFVSASMALGASHKRILVRHVLPNIVSTILINASTELAAVILIEASLAFLGFGVPPPFPSWGNMLQDSQQQMASHPYLALFPGTAIALTVYSLNMFGDALRDVLDPRLRGR